MPEKSISFLMTADKEIVDDISAEINKQTGISPRVVSVSQWAGEAQDIFKLASDIAPTVLPSLVTIITAYLSRRGKHQIDGITIDGEKIDAKGLDANDLIKVIADLKYKKSTS